MSVKIKNRFLDEFHKSREESSKSDHQNSNPEDLQTETTNL